MKPASVSAAAAAPEIIPGRIVDEIHLVRNRGLDGEITHGVVRRNGAENETVVAETAGVIEDAIQARAEAAEARHIHGSIEREVSIHLENRLHTRCAQTDAEK